MSGTKGFGSKSRLSESGTVDLTIALHPKDRVLIPFPCVRVGCIHAFFLPESLPLAQDAESLLGILDAHGREESIDQARSSGE